MSQSEEHLCGSGGPPIIDSHVHFWGIGVPGQSWPDIHWPLLYRDFGPDDLLDAAHGTDLEGAVLVQSQPDDRDTEWLLAMAAQRELIAAVVGWADLAAAHAPKRIAELAGRPKLRGLRPMLQSMESSRWILKPELEPALAAMVDHGLRFDALVQPRHLPAIMELAQRWPRLPIVLDHGAKPNISGGETAVWRAHLAELGRLPNVYCKLSGLRTEQSVGAASLQLQPYVAHLVETFPRRLMWGSDWPVLLQSGDRYRDWLEASKALTGSGVAAGAAACNALFYQTARQFYGLAKSVSG